MITGSPPMTRTQALALAAAEAKSGRVVLIVDSARPAGLPSMVRADGSAARIAEDGPAFFHLRPDSPHLETVAKSADLILRLVP